VLDWVCAATVPEACVTDMKWVNMQSGEFYASSLIKGVVGLNSDPAGIDYGIVTPEPVADSYIQKLKASNIIENEVFAFNLKSKFDSTPSYVDFGFYDTAAMNNPDDLVWISN
jgi:hypothetical protein